MEKGILLLSGGIDSAVAGHLMKERLELVALTFHQVPLSSGEEIEKVKKIARILGLSKLYLVPFVEVLKELAGKCAPKKYFILQKILMLKAAEKIAEKEGAKYLITGENLAQVSSQTLSNLSVITQCIGLEIFRPVLAFDKQEIIEQAREIGTYEISAGPEICCLLGPKHPATKSKLEDIKKELEKLDWERLLGESLQKTEILKF